LYIHDTSHRYGRNMPYVHLNLVSVFFSSVILGSTECNYKGNKELMSKKSIRTGFMKVGKGNWYDCLKHVNVPPGCVKSGGLPR
jgi:hypothetical protein